MNLLEHFLFSFSLVWVCMELTKIRIALQILIEK
jgi:hypothetical protein